MQEKGNICQKSFANRQYLSHSKQLQHSSTPIARFSCVSFWKEFSRKNGFDRHLKAFYCGKKRWHIVGNKVKGQISKLMSQENKARQIFRKTNISCPPDMQTHVCVSGGKKYSFFGKFDVLCFPVTAVLRFALLPYYRWYTVFVKIITLTHNSPLIQNLPIN